MASKPGEGSQGGVKIHLPVQSLGCHPRPTARMPVVVEVCVMWCTLSVAPKLSVLSLFSSILGNSIFLVVVVVVVFCCFFFF